MPARVDARTPTEVKCAPAICFGLQRRFHFHRTMNSATVFLYRQFQSLPNPSWPLSVGAHRSHERNMSRSACSNCTRPSRRNRQREKTVCIRLCFTSRRRQPPKIGLCILTFLFFQFLQPQTQRPLLAGPGEWKSVICQFVLPQTHYLARRLGIRFYLRPP
jgi:hypothetical protein